jgi:hypothetical protein
MTEAEAHALAAKRNKHKGKALWNKVWQPTYSREKGGWAVVLVDSEQQQKLTAFRKENYAKAEQMRAHRERLMAIGSLLNGDMEGFEQHADAALDATLESMRGNI